MNRKESNMGNLTRRSVLRGSFGLAAAGTLARPYIANAAATTANVWWTQGFVPGRGHRVQEDRRRLREGERQHDRLQHHALRAAAPEDRLGGDQRRRPGSVPEQPGRDHCAVRLGRQAGRRDRRRRDAKGGVHRDRAAQQPTATTTSRRSAAFTGCLIRPVRYRTTSGGRWSRRPATRSRTSRRPGMPIYDFFKDVQKKLREQGVRNVYGLGLQGDDQRRSIPTTCSTIS